MLVIEYIAARSGGEVYLRIEDHDSIRSRKIFVDAILEDLHKLSFKFKNVAFDGISPTIDRGFLQSTRRDAYFAYLNFLYKENLTYECSCSRSQIKQRTKHIGKKELYYDGFCLRASDPKTIDTVTRFKVEDKYYKPPNVDNFKPLSNPNQNPKIQCGDFILIDRDSNFSYQFTNVCDDIDQKINVIIRGEDLLCSTGRQLNLMQKIGNSLTPFYYHHPLIKDKEGKKLSKRLLTTGVRHLMQQEMSVEDIRDLAWRTLQDSV